MKRYLRARVRAGRLETAEPVSLPEGTLVELTLEVLEPQQSRPPVTFRARKIGVKQALTREVIYD